MVVVVVVLVVVFDQKMSNRDPDIFWMSPKHREFGKKCVRLALWVFVVVVVVVVRVVVVAVVVEGVCRHVGCRSVCLKKIAPKGSMQGT